MNCVVGGTLASNGPCGEVEHRSKVVDVDSEWRLLFDPKATDPHFAYFW